MQQFEVFWKVLENLLRNDCDGNHFQERTQVIVFFYQFSEHLFMVASQHWTKRIPLNDNIVWCKYSKVIKDLSKSGSFFLIKCPEILRERDFFYFLYAQTLRIFWNVFLSKKTPWNLKGFFVKISPLRIS